MNKSNIKAGQAGTKDDSSTTTQNQQVSQPNANTNVVGSREIKFEIKLKAIEAINGYKVGETVIIVNPIFNINIGIAFFPIDKNFEIVYKRQYTGLKDMDYKDIYEGDLVEIKDPYNNQFAVGVANIIFSHGYVGGWVAQHGSNVLNIGTRTKYIRVVGNIFENPELLQTLR